VILSHLVLQALAAAPLGSTIAQGPTPPSEQPAPAEQDEQGDQTPLERMKRAARARTQEVLPLRREDGSRILPGEIPSHSSVEARATWKGLVANLEQEKPIESFKLGFWLRQENPDPKIRQSNDLDLDFSYLAPRLVRAELESGRTLLRGPTGDFLIDKLEVIELFGRDAQQDIEQLDRMGAIASNFVALTQPVANLRLLEMELTQAPAELHPKLLARSKSLVWLSVTSPDFFLRLQEQGDAAEAAPLYRAQLGIDPASRTVRMAGEDKRSKLPLHSPSAPLSRLTPG
jgi:hypothetical protein